MKKVIKVISLILILVILGTLVFGIAKATDNFKNWDSNHIKNIIDSWNPKKSNKSGFKAYNTKTGKEIDFTTNENLSFDDGIAFRAMSSAPGVEYEATSFSFNVIVEPAGATNKDFSVTLKYVNSEDTVEEVESLIEGNRVTLTCKKPFNKKIKVLIVSSDNPEANADIILDFEAVQILTEEDLDNLIINNKEFEGNEIVKTSSGNYDFKINSFSWEDHKDKFNPELTQDNGVFNISYLPEFNFKKDVIATKVIKPKISLLVGDNFSNNFKKQSSALVKNLKKIGGSNYKLLYNYDLKVVDGGNVNRPGLLENLSFLFFLKGISSNVLEKYDANYMKENLLKDIKFNITYPEGYPEDKKLLFDTITISSIFDVVPVRSLSIDSGNHTFR